MPGAAGHASRTGGTRNEPDDFLTRCTESMSRMHGFTGGSTALWPARAMSDADLRAPASQYMSAPSAYLPTALGAGPLGEATCAPCAGQAGSPWPDGSRAETVYAVGPMGAAPSSRGTVVRRGTSNPPAPTAFPSAAFGDGLTTASSLAALSAMILGRPPPPAAPSRIGDAAPAAASAADRSAASVEHRRPCAHAAVDRMWNRLTDNRTVGAQGCFPLGAGRASSTTAQRARLTPPAAGACFQCRGTDFSTSHGEATCTRCGVVRPYAERVSRTRNGGGPEDEDGTVRADAPRALRRTPPPSSAVAQRNQMREVLNLSNTSMPRGLAVVQRISETAAVEEALREEGANTPRNLQIRGFRLQAELTKHLDASYRLTPDMAERARATAQAAWQRVEAHHRACTAGSSEQCPCHRDLSGCPAVLLSLICLLICLDETLLDATAPSDDDGGGALESLGGLAALREAAAFARTHMVRIGTANEKNTNRTLVIARQLMDDAVVSRRCGELRERPVDGPSPRAGRLAVHAHLAATSGGGPVAQSMRYRECRSEPSDDGSSVSSLGVDLPASPSPRLRGPSSVRQAFAALQQQRSLRMTHSMKQETMRAIGSPQFGAALRDNDFVRSQSPATLAAALAYNVTIGTPPSSHANSTTSGDCMETGAEGDAGATRSLGAPSGTASPMRRNRGDAASFAAVAKMDPVQFRATARKVAELQSSTG